MDSYKIKWKLSAKKELNRIDRSAIQRILSAVESLLKNPYPAGSRKLRNAEHTFRVRVGDYRVVYSIVSNELMIEIIRVGHRKDIYDKLS